MLTRGRCRGATAAAGEGAADAAPPACEGERKEEELEDDSASEACVKGKVRPSGRLDLPCPDGDATGVNVEEQ